MAAKAQTTEVTSLRTMNCLPSSMRDNRCARRSPRRTTAKTMRATRKTRRASSNSSTVKV